MSSSDTVSLNTLPGLQKCIPSVKQALDILGRSCCQSALLLLCTMLRLGPDMKEPLRHRNNLAFSCSTQGSQLLMRCFRHFEIPKECYPSTTQRLNAISESDLWHYKASCSSVAYPSHFSRSCILHDNQTEQIEKLFMNLFRNMSSFPISTCKKLWNKGRTSMTH